MLYVKIMSTSFKGLEFKYTLYIRINASDIYRCLPAIAIMCRLDRGWNKFQGAVLARDGCIYGVPQDLDAVLKIRPDV